MFKRQLLRQARACRGLRVSPSSLLALGSGLAPRTATTCRPAVLTASVSRQIIQRAYSSAAAAAESDNNGGNTNGLITRFADLSTLGVHESLISAITKGMGYETMTDVQSMSINPALQGKDLVAQARTGTGKTLGFLLPVLQKIIKEDPSLGEKASFRGVERARSDDIRGIIISPTRELAEQIAVEAQKLCRFTRIKVQTAVGGHNKRQMLAKTRREGCHLLVGTPGRLLDLLSDELSGIAAPNLNALILDEADRLIEVGFNKELEEIVGCLPHRSDTKRQTLLFSATIPRNVVSLARSYIDPSNFQFVQTINSSEAPTHEKVPQHIVTVPGFEHWAPALMELTEKETSKEDQSQPFKAIVYFNNTSTVKMMGQLFTNLERSRQLNVPVFSIHSDLDQRLRTNIADMFRRARSAILISTDVTARGMDFPNVSHVIQFGVPVNRDLYIHRIGRTGRANKSGEGYLIIHKTELDNARETLPGLPIKRNDQLEVAKADTSSGELAGLPKYFEAVDRAMRHVGPMEIQETYRRLVSGLLPGVRRFDDQQSLVDACNHWVTFQCHLSQPPALRGASIGRAAARLQGINFDNGSLGRGQNDGRRGGFGRGNASNDPFGEMMATQHGFGGRGRGFGGGRGRDGGFGGGRGGGFGGGRGGGRGGDRGFGRDRPRESGY